MLCACALWSSLGKPVHAEPQRSLRQMLHTTWLDSDGAPSGITAIAQASDGSLWIGTKRGLFRFDGMHFQPISVVDESPYTTTEVTTLKTLPNDDLWIGTNGGDIVLLHAGKARRFSLASDLPVNSLLVTSEGVLWAFTSQMLYRFDGSSFLPLPPSGDAQPHNMTEAVVERNDSIRVHTATGDVFELPSGSHRFTHLPLHEDAAVSYGVSPGGMLWESTPTSICQVVSTPPAASSMHCITLPSRLSSAPDILFDKAGDLWLTSRGQGIMRVSFDRPNDLAGARIEHFRQEEGLGSDLALAAFIDRDGITWIGTERGLERMRNGPFVPMHFGIHGSDFGVQPGPGNQVYIARSEGGGVWLVAPNGTATATAVPTSFARITAIAADNEGGLWVASAHGIGHLSSHNRWTTLPAEAERTPVNASAMTVDDSGMLWSNSTTPGLFGWDGKQWHRFHQDTGKRVTAIVTSNRKLWIGMEDGTLAIRRQDTRWLPQNQIEALHGGAITAIAPENTTAWIAGEKGLVYFNGSTSQEVRSTAGPLYRVTAILSSSSKDLWLNTEDGILHLFQTEIDHFLQDPRTPLRFLHYDASDGIEGSPLRHRLQPTGVALQDDRLFFTTQLGVYSIRPEVIASRPPALPPGLLSVVADGHTLPLDSAIAPPHTHDLQLHYSAVSLFREERLLFRYRLVNFDKDWQEVGNRREAVYTNLPPGTYHFALQSSYGDGRWTNMSTPLVLQVKPYFTQTLWFRLLTFGLLVCGIWLFFFLRYRAACRAVQLRLRERSLERERIARDLHDTLLQGFQALLLRFSIISQTAPKDWQSRDEMEHALDLAEDVLVEGRSRVQNLRHAPTTKTPLQDSLGTLSKSFGVESTAKLTVRTDGATATLQEAVQDELFMLGREAILNAYQHSGAREIDVTVRYGKNFALIIRDNGHGIPESVLQNGRRDRHFGLPGMEERARKIGARYRLSSTPLGTVIEVSVPGTIAYVRVPRILSPYRQRIMAVLNKTRIDYLDR
ncbi:sensor histidine kinase [Terriglobus tenax]|uniref:sensor histidine kinase n=1 Tax=Terriglobus tenax TaxID=1111115 RepID=UPI0021DF87A3|nr:sensor histidine kinase [Terriglobus tenax]